MKYKIFHGLGGGFGGAQYQYTTTEDMTEDWAMREAEEGAKEEYDSYGGMHGLETIESIMEEDEDMSYKDAEQAMNEAYESWIDYHIEEVTE